MILGIWQKDRPAEQLRQELLQALGRISPAGEIHVWAGDGLAVGWRPEGLPTMDEGPQPFKDLQETCVLCFQGKIYNRNQLAEVPDADGGRSAGSSGDLLISLYRKKGQRFLQEVNGKFAFALWDRQKQVLLLGRDRLGIEPMFYRYRGDRLLFSTSLRVLLASGWIEADLDEAALLQYLLFCYNPSQETVLRGVKKLPAGHFWQASRTGMALRRYWRLSFAEGESKTKKQYTEEILNLIEDAIRLRIEPGEGPGIFLSGGTDSSTLVSLTTKLSKQHLRTFSFRCRGESFDESSWAQFVADQYGTTHTVVSFDATGALLIEDVVKGMDEPFCDIGIEIGTYLLGRSASGQVGYVFSGEGGDEAFGGHPVYQADQVAALVDWIPRFLVRPLMQSLQKLPDSDKKKNWQVKAKRFAYSLSFPRELLSHRWRTYYTAEQLRWLCTKEFLERCDMDARFDGMLRHSHEADGADALSRSLYSDYGTLVDFYLRRLQLLRIFSVESRLPLLDHRLVEYAAGIPSGLKVRRFGETKYLYKRILEGVIPHQILYERPKLGHSVPLKNWLRQDERVRRYVQEHLHGGILQERGFICQEAVRQMIDEHTTKADNHSHRLWALLVLELWMRQHLGR